MPRFRKPLVASDEDEMRRVQADDVDAFERLYDRHVVRAFRVAGAVCHDAGRVEEAVHDGFLAIWRSRAGYRPEIGSFQGWAMKIVHNRAIDASRRDSARPRVAAVDVEDSQVADPTHMSLQDEVIARSEGHALRAALRQLPDTQAEVITLAYYGGLTHTEIAKQLALPAGTVKGRMRLGLEKLRTQMQAEV